MKNLFSFLLMFLTSSAIHAETIEKTPAQLCTALDQAFQKRKWGNSACSLAGDSSVWKIGGKSIKGRPFIYTVYGDEKATNTTLIFSMVHGDEITPLY